VHGYKYLPDAIQSLEEEDMKEKEQWKKLMCVRDSLYVRVWKKKI